MFETKVHYKSYKAGKQWLYMAIGVTSLCAGLALTVPANAATNAADASDSTTVVQADSSSDSAGSSQPAGDDSEQPASTTEESKTDQTAAGQDESAQPGNEQKSGEDTTNQSNGTANSAGGANADQSSTESHQEKSASDSSTITPVTESTPVTTPDADTDSQTTEPTDVTSSADMTAPLTVIKAGTATDQSQNKVATSVKVTATNDKGTLTSKDSTTNNQTIGVNNQDTSLTATYQITNQTDTGQGLWITFDLPAYANHDTGIVMAGDADVSALESQIPQGVQLNYITIDGSKYRSAAGLDLSTVRQLQLTGTLAVGGSYTATIPLVITSKGATETATLSVHDFTPDWSGSTLYLQAMDPVLPHATTDLPTPTTPDAVTTIDPTVTTPVTAITNNPNGSEVTDTAPVDASVRLTATNQNGTATSFSTSNDLETYTAAIVDANATDLTALMDLTNQTDTVQVVNTYFSLPNYYTSLNSSLTSQITMSDDADVQAMLATVPSGLHVNFVVGNTSYASYEALMAANPDFHWSSLTQFHVTGYLAGQSGYTLNVPLTVQTNDEYTSQGVSILSQYSFGAVTTNGALHFKVATPRDPVVGQYEAIVADPDDDGYDYEIAPTEVQEAMPSVGQDQVAYYNYYDQGGHATNYSSTTFFNGGTVTVDWKKAGIADALKDLGYSVALNAQGQPIESLAYASLGHDLSPKGDLIAAGDSSIAPSVYIIVRQVLATKDSTIQAGSSWSDAVNFVSGIDNQDNPLSVKDVQVSVKDPDGILHDGKTTGAGTLYVTYTYQVADGYDVSRTATVTVTPAPDTTPDPGTTTTPGTGNQTDPGTTTTDPTVPDEGTSGTDTTTNPVVSDAGDGDTVVTTTDPIVQVNQSGQAATVTAQAPQTTTNGNGAATTETAPKQGGAAATVTTGTQSGATTAVTAGATANAAASTTPTATTMGTGTAGTVGATTQLPQTGDRPAAGWIAVGLAGLLSALGLAGARSKKRS